MDVTKMRSVVMMCRRVKRWLQYLRVGMRNMTSWANRRLTVEVWCWSLFVSGGRRYCDLNYA